jgi:hypothetical protein
MPPSELTNVTIRDRIESLEVDRARFHQRRRAASEKRRHGHVSREIWDRIVAALKRHGVELLPKTDEHGAGVQWILPRTQRPRYW